MDAGGEWKDWLDKLMAMRANTESYILFFETVVSCIIGKGTWKANAGTKKLSEFITASDEAFGLLLLENSWDVWVTMSENKRQGRPMGKAKGGDNGGRAGELMTRYTMNGAHVKKHQGWSQEGLDRFVDLAELVKEDRAKEAELLKGEPTFEDKLMARMAEKSKKGRPIMRPTVDTNNEPKKKMYFEA
jgi:hypothetical protein